MVYVRWTRHFQFVPLNGAAATMEVRFLGTVTGGAEEGDRERDKLPPPPNEHHFIRPFSH